MFGMSYCKTDECKELISGYSFALMVLKNKLFFKIACRCVSGWCCDTSDSVLRQDRSPATGSPICCPHTRPEVGSSRIASSAQKGSGTQRPFLCSHWSQWVWEQTPVLHPAAERLACFPALLMMRFPADACWEPVVTTQVLGFWALGSGLIPTLRLAVSLCPSNSKCGSLEIEHWAHIIL